MTLEQILKTPDWIVPAILILGLVVYILGKILVSALNYFFFVQSTKRNTRIQFETNLYDFKIYCDKIIRTKSVYSIDKRTSFVEILDNMFNIYVDRINSLDREFSIYFFFNRRDKIKLINKFKEIRKYYTKELTTSK